MKVSGQTMLCRRENFLSLPGIDSGYPSCNQSIKRDEEKKEQRKVEGNKK